MKPIILLASFQLQSPNLLKDWIKKSNEINIDLQQMDGFIYRDSVIGEDGTVYCIVKWESAEKRAEFLIKRQSGSYIESRKEFARIVNMDSMKREELTVI